jgi:hypothetical protein
MLNKRALRKVALELKIPHLVFFAIYGNSLKVELQSMHVYDRAKFCDEIKKERISWMHITFQSYGINFE